MRSIWIISIIAAIIVYGCRSTKPSGIESKPVTVLEPAPIDKYKSYADPTTWLLGYFNLSRLNQAPHAEWYTKEMDDYKSNREAVGKLRDLVKDNISIKIVLGTWCPDSRREVPRFMKIMEEIDFPTGKLQMIGVDNLKISPIENYESLDIQRVPTFIIYRNNIEAGRIIENPVTSLEQDMVNILSRNEK
jgi:thiol-disulfide isomerase/thioredoxin